jgi:hypothetical protein
MDWLFQCNPRRYDLAAFLDSGGTHEDWSMNQGRNLVSPEDRVFFWQAGEEARLLALVFRSNQMIQSLRVRPRQAAAPRGWAVNHVFDPEH